MSVATIDRVGAIYGLLKQHEKSLARVACSGFRVESDIFSELLFDTRAMALELESVLDKRHISVADIDVPAEPDFVSPRILIDQRKTFRAAYDNAIAAPTQDETTRNILTAQRQRLDGSAQEKLDVLSAAVVSGQ